MVAFPEVAVAQSVSFGRDISSYGAVSTGAISGYGVDTTGPIVGTYGLVGTGASLGYASGYGYGGIANTYAYLDNSKAV